uniref:Fibrinogen C-terminal domain-containing protein n=1 Tax=Macrostomum lignano TaxID=282301 RepID=A0A1I8ILS7_9PLAT
MCSNLFIKLIVIMCVAAAESTNTRLEFSIQPASTVEAAVVTSLTGRNAIHCAAKCTSLQPCGCAAFAFVPETKLCLLSAVWGADFATAAPGRPVHRRRLQSRGLQKLHNVTGSSPKLLRVEAVTWSDVLFVAEYSGFTVGDASTNYTMNFVSYLNGSSNMSSDSLTVHKGMQFSTMDRDNDNLDNSSCSSVSGNGGWWFNGCAQMNPNGKYRQSDEVDATAMIWAGATYGVLAAIKSVRLLLQTFHQYDLMIHSLRYFMIISSALYATAAAESSQPVRPRHRLRHPSALRLRSLRLLAGDEALSDVRRLERRLLHRCSQETRPARRPHVACINSDFVVHWPSPGRSFWTFSRWHQVIEGQLPEEQLELIGVRLVELAQAVGRSGAVLQDEALRKLVVDVLRLVDVAAVLVAVRSESGSSVQLIGLCCRIPLIWLLNPLNFLAMPLSLDDHVHDADAAALGGQNQRRLACLQCVDKRLTLLTASMSVPACTRRRKISPCCGRGLPPSPGAAPSANASAGCSSSFGFFSRAASRKGPESQQNFHGAGEALLHGVVNRHPAAIVPLVDQFAHFWPVSDEVVQNPLVATLRRHVKHRPLSLLRECGGFRNELADIAR